MNETEFPESEYDFGVIIPTVGTPEVLIPGLHMLCTSIEMTDHKVLVIPVLNPLDEQHGRISESEIAAMVLPENCDVEVLVFDGPRGFGGAINRGVDHMLRNHGAPKMTVVYNDDIRAPLSIDWLGLMHEALTSEYVQLISEPPKMKPGQSFDEVDFSDRPRRPVSGYGRVGIVGPMSNMVAGMQLVQLDQKIPVEQVSSFAQMFRDENRGKRVTADFLSGFCLGFSAEFIGEMAFRYDGDQFPEDYSGESDAPRHWCLFDEDAYPIAGFEDNDICVRARHAGFRAIIAGDVYLHHLGHQTFDAHFSEMHRGMRNHLHYFRSWKDYTKRDDQECVGVYRVKLETGNDFLLFRESLVRFSRLLDGYSILLTGHPLEAQRFPDFDGAARHFSQFEHDWLRSISGPVKPEDVAKATQKYVCDLLSAVDGARFSTEDRVRVEFWAGEFNERDERNRAIEVAESLDPDWLFSIDHDEIPEDRITRDLIERYMRHPDPMVTHIDLGWLNHWDSDRLIRRDKPWGDDGTYQGGMHGFRLWRSQGGRIQAGTDIGLHCGNSPDASVQAKRVAGFRMRHLGYIRLVDRQRKFHRYMTQDTEMNPLLVGGSNYGHILNEEGMRLDPYVANDGIGLHMLCYKGEDPTKMCGLLDWLYGVVDVITLVWTEDDFDLPQDWKDLGELFEVEWIHHPLRNNIAEARNAGIDHLRENHELGWALFLDPDESFQDPFAAAICIRRMAEVTDSWGWLFRFANVMPGRNQPNYSESVRMSRLEDEGIMRMNGRVHEGFDNAAKLLAERGVSMQMRYAPFGCVNTGQMLSPEEMQKKLDRYRDLLLLELEENPLSAQAWTSLGVHCDNEGDIAKAVKCFENGMDCPGRSYLPYREMAAHYLRLSKICMQEAFSRVAPGHEYHENAKQILGFLDQVAVDRPLVGLAAVGKPVGCDFELPPGPSEIPEVQAGAGAAK